MRIVIKFRKFFMFLIMFDDLNCVIILPLCCGTKYVRIYLNVWNFVPMFKFFTLGGSAVRKVQEKAVVEPNLREWKILNNFC